jgi:nicotinamidase-related amidase
VIDYRPPRFSAVHPIDPDLLLENIVSTVKTAKTFDLPIVHSTINVATGRTETTVPRLAGLLEDYPAIDGDRYDVYPVVDAVGGTSEDAHRAGLERVVEAGGQPITWAALAVELQRDRAREDTVADVIEIVLTQRLLKA